LKKKKNEKLERNKKNTYFTIYTRPAWRAMTNVSRSISNLLTGSSI